MRAESAQTDRRGGGQGDALFARRDLLKHLRDDRDPLADSVRAFPQHVAERVFREAGRERRAQFQRVQGRLDRGRETVAR